ncbi:protoglobin domain-containing protein [Pseudomonadota bacterium]
MSVGDKHRYIKHYGLTEWDESLLKKMAPMMDKHKSDFIEAFYKHTQKFANASKYLKDDKIICRHKHAIQVWYVRLFDSFDDEYLRYLEGIGYTHVKVGLPSHYVNSSISFVREYCTNLVTHEVTDCAERGDMLKALDKMLDINLDVLTASYIEEEVNLFFISKKAEGKLISFTQRFSYGLNLVLVLGLVALGLIVLVLFTVDLLDILKSDLSQTSLEKGLLATLGALLMLWVVIELVDTEVEHLQGAKFTIKVFVGVALVAVIRKILITSLKSDAIEAQWSLIAALAVLGGLYWLISLVERQERLSVKKK